MKKMVIALLILFAVGVIVASQQGSEMQEVQTEIEIAAPPEKVWEVLTDFNGWNEWNPIVNNISGSGALGAKLDITMCSKEGKGRKDGPKYSPTITIFDQAKQLRWRAHMMASFIFTNDKLVELEKTSTGTRLIHKELFGGLMVSMMWGKMKDGVPPMLKLMNEALKEKVEKN